MPEKIRVTSGVSQLDRLLGGLFIGDNVVWHDDSGSLAGVFCLNFIQASQNQNKPIIYVSFDRSPRNLLQKLGTLAENDSLTILDCFTSGKGASSPVFLKFYEEKSKWPCRIVQVKDPRQMNHFVDELYGIHGKMLGDVRFVFESITGMQELWGGEEEILNFYSHSCPRLYELNTIAYWIMEKKAHSPRLRAQINQIAQVVIDLSIKRGTTSLTVFKAESHDLESLHEPHNYWTKDLAIDFEDQDKRAKGGIHLGLRLKDLRTKRGLSQTDLARLVGVTPSTISQVESNLIYPSLPALLKMAEILSVDVSSFFNAKAHSTRKVIFPADEGMDVKLLDMTDDSVHAKLLTPADFDTKAEPYLIEIPPHKSIPSHFFIHKGDEMGYLLSGKLVVKLNRTTYTLHSGDVVYLTSEMPAQWKNPGSTTAKLLWVKIR